MKAKHTILLIALGLCLEYLASLTRFLHRSETYMLTVIATILKVVGVLWFGYKVITYDGFKRFMER